MRHLAVMIAVGALLCVSRGAALAQERPDTAHLAVGRIIGRIVDAVTKQPIEGASVRLPDHRGFERITDSRGRFIFVGVPRGVRKLEIGHVAYGEGAQLLNVPGGETVEFEAELAQSALRLDSLVITAQVHATQLVRVGFHDRARRGFGHFFSGGDVSSSRIGEALYSVPRIMLRQVGSARRRVTIRTPRGECVPEIYLDGVWQRWAEGDIESVVAGLEIEALEVYRGYITPPEFDYTTDASAPCGAIVVWTRK
jgi:hypothetical protein